MTVNVAIYARYSCELQNDRSIEDQVALCRRALRGDERVAGVFFDRARSGAFSHDRDGLGDLLSNMQRGAFSVILTENLNRMSRCMEDTARIFKLTRFHGVSIRTLSDGEISEMHVGFNSTVSAMQIRQVREQTRRGQMGNIRAGKAGGGLAYGYRVRYLNDAGQPEPGLREIDPVQAEVVRSIYRDYAAGETVAAIVRRLNAEGVPSPSGGLWARTTILGHFERKDGILQNPLYRGLLVWGRCPEDRHPVSARRVVRVKDESQWVTQHVPALRIVDDELWHEVQHIRALTYRKHAPRRAFVRFELRCLCAGCGAGIRQVEQGYLMCDAAKRHQTCHERRRYRIDEVTGLVFGHLRRLPASDWQAWVGEHSAAYAAAVRRMTEAGREIERDVEAFAAGGTGTSGPEGGTAMRALQEAQAALARLPHPSSLSRPAFDAALRRARTDEAKRLSVTRYLEGVTLGHDADGDIVVTGIRPDCAAIAELTVDTQDGRDTGLSADRREGRQRNL